MERRSVLALVALAIAVSRSRGQSTISLGNETAVTECLTENRGFMVKAMVMDPAWLTIFLFLLLAYLFWAVAYVVERVMMPALQVGIAQRIKLPESISGASLLALGGSSVPMLFINIMSLSQDAATPTGFGMVLGGAALNFLFVLPSCFFTSNWVDTQPPLYWWPLVRDITVYMIGLGVVGLFLEFGTRDWEASVAEKSSNCWAGQESLCCFQELDHTNPSSGVLEPVEYGVLVWWEGLILVLLYVIYLCVLRVHHRVKWMVDSFVEWVCRYFLFSDYQKHRDETKSRRRQDERQEHLEKEQQMKYDLESGMPQSTRHKLKKKRSKTGYAMNVGEGNSSNLLVMLGVSGKKLPPAVQRACAIIVLRLGSSAREAFDSIDSDRTGVISDADIDKFVEYWVRDLFGKEFVSSCRAQDLQQRCEAVSTHLKSMMLDTASSTTPKSRSGSGSRSRSSSSSVNGSGDVVFGAFEAWFLKAEARLVREMNIAFDVLDENGRGEVQAEKLGAALELLGCRPSKKAVRITREKLEINANGVIGRKEFDEWYRTSMVWTSNPMTYANLAEHRSGYESDATVATASGRSLKGDPIPSVWSTLDGAMPRIEMWSYEGDSILYMIVHLMGLPMRAVVFMTTAIWTGQADELTAAGSFFWIFVSLGWIAVMSWVMLFATESIALTSGIPNSVLGSTVLAIGVNAPQLLAAVQRTVAMREEPDRAYHIIRTFEHTIKGNVFDLIMGLPLAWMIASAAVGHPIFLGASNISSSIAMLAAMLGLVLFLMLVARWELNIVVAGSMFILYFLWLLQDILLADWVKPVPSIVQCSGCRMEMVCANV